MAIVDISMMEANAQSHYQAALYMTKVPCAQQLGTSQRNCGYMYAKLVCQLKIAKGWCAG